MHFETLLIQRSNTQVLLPQGHPNTHKPINELLKLLRVPLNLQHKALIRSNTQFFETHFLFSSIRMQFNLIYGVKRANANILSFYKRGVFI